MSYKRKQIVKKSFIQWIIDTINTDASFVCGDGSTMITIYDAFPVNPATFKVPSMSIDFDAEIPRLQYEMGPDATYRYDMVVDMWFSGKVAGEYVSALLTEGMEDELIEYRDYNQGMDGATILGRMFVKEIESSPIRVEMAGFESDYRYQMNFRAEYNDVY